MLFRRRFAGLGFAFNHLDHTVNSRSEALTDFPACQGGGAAVREQAIYTKDSEYDWD
jgi:hypothetical protein